MINHYLRTARQNFHRNKVPTAVNLISPALGLMCFVAAYALSTDFSSIGKRYPNADRIYVITESIVEGEQS